MTNSKYILLAYISLFSLSLLDNGRGPAYPSIIDHFHISNQAASYIFSMASLSGLVVNITARWWLSRISIITVAQIALFTLGLSGLGLHYSAVLTDYSFFLLSSSLLGIGLSTCSISMNILITRGTSINKRRQFFAGLHGVYGLSSFLAPLIFGQILLRMNGWSEYFLITGIFAILLFILTTQLSKSAPGKVAEKITEKRKIVTIKVRKSKRFLTGILFGAYVSSEIIVSSRLPLYLEKEFNFTQYQSSRYLSLFFLCLMTGRFLFSAVPFRIKNINLMMLSPLLTLIFFSLGKNVSPLFFAFNGLTMSFFFPIAMDYLTEIYDQEIDFMISSVMTSISICLAFTHFIFGSLAENYGIRLAFDLVPLLTVLTLSLAIIHKKAFKKATY